MTAAQAAVKQAEHLADAARGGGRALRLCPPDHPAQRRNRLPAGMESAGAAIDDAPLCREGTHGAEFVGPKPQGGELVVSKSRYNAFYRHRPG